MKHLKIIPLILLTSTLSAQQIIINDPNYGLAISATGITICTVGATMRTSLQHQYIPRYGYNYISYDGHSNKTLRISTMLVGTVITLGGIIIQNIKRKRNV